MINGSGENIQTPQTVFEGKSKQGIEDYVDSGQFRKRTGLFEGSTHEHILHVVVGNPPYV